MMNESTMDKLKSRSPAAAVFLAMLVTAPAQATFVSFDVPGAGTGSFQGTLPVAINAEPGAITGTYTDAGIVSHGFLRSSNGVITTFDDPDASPTRFFSTWATAINSNGTIVGCGNFVLGTDFVRSAQGAFTTLAPPSPGDRAPFCYAAGDTPLSIALNAEGAVVGTYGGYRGFLRAKDGTYNMFDAETSSLCCVLTFLRVVNESSRAAGYHYRSSPLVTPYHGFLQSPTGTFFANAGINSEREILADPLRTGTRHANIATLLAKRSKSHESF